MQSKSDLIAALKASLNDSTSGEAPAPKSKGVPVTQPIAAGVPKTAVLTPVAAKSVDASHPFAKFLNNQEDEAEEVVSADEAEADESGDEAGEEQSTLDKVLDLLREAVALLESC